MGSERMRLGRSEKMRKADRLLKRYFRINMLVELCKCQQT